MIKYIVDEDKRVVTASIDGCENDVLNTVCRRFNVKISERNGDRQTSQFIKVAQMKPEYHAVAKCHPDDAFDAETGKALARQRLLNKYHKDRVRALNNVDAYVNTWESEIMLLIKKEIDMLQEHK